MHLPACLITYSLAAAAEVAVSLISIIQSLLSNPDICQKLIHLVRSKDSLATPYMYVLDPCFYFYKLLIFSVVTL
jgi:hypothetical protein